MISCLTESRSNMGSNRTRHGRTASRREGSPDLSLEDTLFNEDDRDHHRGGRSWETDKKTLQLCRQVHRRLEIAFCGDLEDPRLRGLWVHAVVPEPGGSALRVQVVADGATALEELLPCLRAAQSTLRGEIAEAIHRKRAPQLRFEVLPRSVAEQWGQDDDE